MKRFLIFLAILMLGLAVNAEEKIIRVPSEMTVEMILANDQGLLNGNFDIRARIYDPTSKKRVWFENFKNHPVKDGGLVLVMNSIPSLNAYELHRKDLQFVVTVGDESAEIPLLTEIYSYRSLFSEFGWATRFPDILYFDREKNYVGIGTQVPKAPLDVNGAIKLGFEDTEVTGAIRWSNNSLYVKHPTRWVDLLFSDDTFQGSRWTDSPTNLQLTSKNYFIGIGEKYPDEQLYVKGGAFFDGSLSATDVAAGQYHINTFRLSNAGVVGSQLHIIDNNQQLLWTPENLIVGKISGNANGLEDVGLLTQDFESSLIKEIHLDGAVIASRNLLPGAIKASHLGLRNIQIDRLIPAIINADLLANDSISSDNIIPETLTFDILQENDVSDFVPDGFFQSSIIATGSVHDRHFQDQNLQSNDIALASIVSGDIKAGVILGSHIANNQVTLAKFKAGEITSNMFSGVLPVSFGGTGISSVFPNRLVYYSGTTFKGDGSLYIDDQHDIGLFDSNNLTSLQRQFDYPLVVGSLTNDVLAILKRTNSNAVQIPMSNSSSAFAIELNSNGKLSFSNSTIGFFMHSKDVFSLSETKDDALFDLGGAIQIGKSDNTSPPGGTFEYDSTAERFRFYDGSQWKVVTKHQHGIGAPVNQDSHIAKSDASIIGQARQASIQATDSFLPRVTDSQITGSRIISDSISNSGITGDGLGLSVIQNSVIDSNRSMMTQVIDGSVAATNATLHHVTGSKISGEKFSAHSVINSSAKLQDSTIYQSSDVEMVLADAMVKDVSMADLTGSSLIIQQASDAVVSGHGNHLNDVDALHVSGNKNHVQSGDQVAVFGDQNQLLSVDSVRVVGDGNIGMHASHMDIIGNKQRIFGDDVHVQGDNNLVIGDNIQLQGNQNMVLNATNEPMVVAGNQQLVMQAPGGVHIQTGDGMVVSATAASGGWTMVSDKNLKTNIQPVNYKSVFDALMAVPVQQWEYDFNRGTQHIGPMAQDFKSHFNVGEDERFITNSDADGVAFAALKHLISEMDALQLRMAAPGHSDIENLDHLLDRFDSQIQSYQQSLKLKKTAFKQLVDQNLVQYEKIDKQYKVVGNLLRYDNKKRLQLQIMEVFGLIIFGFAIGFYVMKMYHNKRQN